MEWQGTEDERGGITWIELYAMYAIHGGCEYEEEEKRKDPLRKAPMLQKQLANSKKAVRKVKTHTMKESQEWIGETSYVAKHRLKEAGIENRRAARKGIAKSK